MIGRTQGFIIVLTVSYEAAQAKSVRGIEILWLMIQKEIFA